MTLTVRLPQPLEQTLEEYATSHGLTKSHVVQEALAAYLVRTQAEQVQAQPVSANFLAFQRAGLLGCATGMNGTSATKEVVRQRIVERVKDRK